MRKVLALALAVAALLAAAVPAQASAYAQYVEKKTAAGETATEETLPGQGSAYAQYIQKKTAAVEAAQEAATGKVFNPMDARDVAAFFQDGAPAPSWVDYVYESEYYDLVDYLGSFATNSDLLYEIYSEGYHAGHADGQETRQTEYGLSYPYDDFYVGTYESYDGGEKLVVYDDHVAYTTYGITYEATYIVLGGLMVFSPFEGVVYTGGTYYSEDEPPYLSLFLIEPGVCERYAFEKVSKWPQ